MKAPEIPDSRFGLACGLALLAVAVAGTAGLGGFVLLDVDEPKFVAASREMARGGDAIVPHFNGEERFDKPILIYWLQALAMRLFGIGEFAARLPSMLSVAGSVPLVAGIGRMLGLRATWAMLAGLAVGTSGVAQVLARGATADALLLFVTSLLAWLQVRVFVGSRTRRVGLAEHLAVWSVGGLAFLVKGPPALVAPLALACGLVAAGYRPKVWRMALGLAAAAAVVLAWGIPALVRSEGRFWEVGILHHVVDRSLEPFEGHGGYAPWWYLFYVVAIPVGLLPWSAFLWKLRDVRRAELFDALPGSGRVLLWWAGGVFAVFTIATSKLAHYPLPGYAPWAVLILLVVQHSSAGEGRTRADRWVGGTLALVGVVTATACVAVFPGFGLDLPPTAVLTSVVFALGLGLAGRQAFLGRTTVAAWSTAVTSTVGFGLLTTLVVVPFFHHGLAAEVRRAAAEHLPPGMRVVTFELPMPSLTYYLDRRIEKAWELAPTKDPVAGALQALEEPDTVLLARADRLDRLLDRVHGLPADRAAQLRARLTHPEATLRGFLPSKGKVLEVAVIRGVR